MDEQFYTFDELVQVYPEFTTAFAIGIYLYTIFAIKRETFSDDFEMPNPLLEEDEQQ